jgi:hypothetical protein
MDGLHSIKKLSRKKKEKKKESRIQTVLQRSGEPIKDIISLCLNKFAGGEARRFRALTRTCQGAGTVNCQKWVLRSLHPNMLLLSESDHT